MQIGLTDKALESMRKGKMKEEEWENFWEYLLNAARDKEVWWLDDWLEREKEWYEMKKDKEWKCERCGKCCKFIVIPVRDRIEMETREYLVAHGIICDGKKLIIPAVCRHLKKGDLRGEKGEYWCSIHNDKFVNCRLGGQKECKEAKKAWSLLNPKS